MDESKMKDVCRKKLHQLYLMEQTMKMDKNTSKEELENLKQMIKNVKKEYTQALLEEKGGKQDGKKL